MQLAADSAVLESHLARSTLTSTHSRTRTNQEQAAWHLQESFLLWATFSCSPWTLYINTDITMKPVEFLGDSLDRLRAFPEGARHDAGFQLERVQRGLDPDDWKPMKSIGPGVREIRVRDAAGAFRVIYIAALADAVYVLHAFQKSTPRTSKRGLMIAEIRFRTLRRSTTR
jgi:phage-related protein